jgi:radical SAM superfamily enzyme YgiQ (UPF0313 family)
VRANSSHSVCIADLSIECLLDLLEPSALDRTKARLERRLDLLSRQNVLGSAEQDEYERVATAALTARRTRDSMPGALRTFRDSQRLSVREARAEALQVLSAGLDMITAAHWPFEIDASGMRHGDAPYRYAAVLESIAKARSPFADSLEERIEGRILDEAPNIVGVSVNYYGQLLAGLEACRFVKKRFPGLATVMGGGLMPELGTYLASDSFSHLLDHVVCYEGETALVSLLDALEAGGERELSDCPTPNLVVAHGTSIGVPRRHREDASTLPTPDFSGLPLASYLSPKPILPLLTSRGCYYADCAFCTHFHTYGMDYRVLDPRRIVASIAELSEKHQTDCFYFVDESLAPSKARSISEGLLARGLAIRWGTEIRFERALTNDILSLMALAGCQVLSFGLESGAQRVLDLMNKGIIVADIHRIIEASASKGIFVHAMCIVGFPGETDSELEETLSLLAEHRNHLAMIGFSPFTLNVNSVVQRKPEDFGVIQRDDADPFRPDRNFDVQAGLSRNDAAARYRQIEESDLVRTVNDRYAVATREHFVLLGPPSAAALTRPGRVKAGVRSIPPLFERPPRVLHAPASNFSIQTHPFDYSEVRQGALAAREYRRAALLDLKRPKKPDEVQKAPAPSILCHVHKRGATYQVSPPVLDLLDFCGQPRTDAEIARWLAGGDSSLPNQDTQTEAMLTSLVQLGLLTEQDSGATNV